MDKYYILLIPKSLDRDLFKESYMHTMCVPIIIKGHTHGFAKVSFINDCLC